MQIHFHNQIYLLNFPLHFINIACEIVDICPYSMSMSNFFKGLEFSLILEIITDVKLAIDYS